MQALTVGLDVLGVLLGAGGGLAWFDAQRRVRTVESRLEDAKRRLKEREEATGKTAEAPTAKGAAAAKAAPPARAAAAAPPAADGAKLSASLDAANRRVSELEKELARVEAERGRMEADFQRRVNELTSRRDTAAVVPMAPAGASEAPAMRAPRPKSLQTASANGTAKGPVSLLFASGDAAASATMTAHLSESGYTLHMASNLQEVLQTARDAKPALIALDIQLGKRGGDGFAALTALKKDESLRDIPVILICPVKDRDHAIELGAAGCVPTPITPNVLLGALNAAMVAHKKRSERSRLAKAAKSSVAAAAGSSPD